MGNCFYKRQSTKWKSKVTYEREKFAPSEGKIKLTKGAYHVLPKK